jgi:RNase P subunit RPR2
MIKTTKRIFCDSCEDEIHVKIGKAGQHCVLTIEEESRPQSSNWDICDECAAQIRYLINTNKLKTAGRE